MKTVSMQIEKYDRTTGLLEKTKLAVPLELTEVLLKGFLIKSSIIPKSNVNNIKIFHLNSKKSNSKNLDDGEEICKLFSYSSRTGIQLGFKENDILRVIYSSTIH